MKKLFTALFAVAIMFAITLVMGKDSPGKIEKGKTENVAVQTATVQIEHKEAYKIDDGEYEGIVITNSGFSGQSLYVGAGILAVIGLVSWAIKSALFRRTKLYVATRLIIASLIVAMSLNTAPLAGMVIAGIVIVFPSLKAWAVQRNYARLAAGEQDEEIEAINKISKQIEGFKTILGDKADKADFKAVEKAITELKEGLSKLEGTKIEEKMTEINKAITKFGEQVTELKEDVAKAKENTGKGKPTPFVTTKEIEDFIKSTFKDGQKTRDHAAIKVNGDHIFKAAETFGIPSFFEGAAGTVADAFTGRFIDPTLYQRKRKRNLILDHFAIETITVPKLIYLEKKEVSGSGDSGSTSSVGGADWIVSGAAKPKRSFRVGTGEVEAKKVAIFGTVEDKLLRDVPSLENWIRDDFQSEMREKYNDGLLNNNPAVDENAPLGLKNNAIQYSATPAFSLNIPAPNYIDMVVAAAAKMADLKEQPGKAFVATDVFYAIHILKDSDERYQNNDKVYTNALGQLVVAGVQIVEADSEDVPSTHLLLTSVDPGFKIKNYGPAVFERGLNGTDFQEDKTSYRGYQEVLSYIPEHKENTVMYDTWANIAAAITKA